MDSQLTSPVKLEAGHKAETEGKGKRKAKMNPNEPLKSFTINPFKTFFTCFQSHSCTGLAPAAPVHSGDSNIVGFAAGKISEVTPKGIVGAADITVAVLCSRRGHKHLGPRDLSPSNSTELTA